MSAPCTLCEPLHPKKLHYQDEDHLLHHHDAQDRLAALPSCTEDARESLRLRLRGHIKATLKAHLHRSQTSHRASAPPCHCPLHRERVRHLVFGPAFHFSQGALHPRPWRNPGSGDPEPHSGASLGHAGGARSPHLLRGHACERDGVLCASVLLCGGLGLHRANQGLLPRVNHGPL